MVQAVQSLPNAPLALAGEATNVSVKMDAVKVSALQLQKAVTPRFGHVSATPNQTLANIALQQNVDLLALQQYNPTLTTPAMMASTASAVYTAIQNLNLTGT